MSERPPIPLLREARIVAQRARLEADPTVVRARQDEHRHHLVQPVRSGTGRRLELSGRGAADLPRGVLG